MDFDYKEERNLPTTKNTEDDHSFEKRSAEENPFDRLMFGPSRSKKPQSPEPKQEDESNILNQVNLEEIMGHIDALMGSAKELKPMFNKIRPLIDQFLKK